MAGGEMKRKSFFTALCRDERGTSAVELGLICAMIVLIMLGALKGFAAGNAGIWNKVNSASQDAVAGSTA